MKTSKYHIICSWILLGCFIAGQYMVYAHQHTIANTSSISKSTSRQTVGEKCQICDFIAHNAMITVNTACTAPVIADPHVFEAFNHDFKSIQLILSCGRAPPSAICS